MTCPHLSPHVDWLHRDEAWIVRSQPSPQPCYQDLVFSHGPRLADVKTVWRLTHGVVTTSTGVYCPACQTSLSWTPGEQTPADVIARLAPELRALLEAELAAGNEIAETNLGWGAPKAALVLLRFPFRAPLEQLPEGVTYREVNDPHWWKAEYLHGATLGCVACRF